MRVLILSHYYSPEPIPKPGDLAVALVERGHSVSVITGFPNYPEGRIYPGFRLSLWSHCDVDGIPVIRAYQYPYHGKSAFLRFCNYFSFVLTAPIASLFAPRCDVIYVWHPPLTVGLAAWFVSLIRRAPFVYDVQDIWPESAVLSGMLKQGFITRMLTRLEKFVYSKAAHLFVVTQGARANLIEKNVPPSKVSVMSHWIDEHAFARQDRDRRNEVRREHGWESRFVVMFAGNMGIVQALDRVIEAAERLKAVEDVLFIFVGDGADKERLLDLAAKANLGRTLQFINRVPAAAMPDLMAGADALLVHLKYSPLSEFIIPSKTYAYLAAGKPIIMAMQGAAADLVAESHAGIIVPPEDPALLAEAVLRIRVLPETERVQMGLNGRRFLELRFSKKDVLSQYEDKLRENSRSAAGAAAQSEHRTTADTL